MIFFRGGSIGGGGGRSGLGKDFGGLLSYLYEGDLEPGMEVERGQAREDRVDWISSRNLPRGVDVANWKEVEPHFSTLHGRTQQPVYHVGLALEPGASLSREQWERSVDRLIKGLGLEDHRVLVVAHKDSHHQHVHLVVNRVHPGTLKVWKPNNDGYKSAAVLRELERELGLRELGVEAKPALRLTSGEHAVAKSSELPPLAARARAEVLVDFQESTSWTELGQRLGAKGYGLEAGARGGGVVLVGSEGLRVSISRLDSDLSGPKLARRYGETFGQHLERRVEGVEVSRSERPFVVPETGRLADELGARYATWTRGDAMRELSGQAGREQLVAALVASPHVVQLPTEPGRAQRFASVSYLAQEISVFDAAKSLEAAKDHPRGHQVAVGEGPAVAVLSGEQRIALEHVAGGGGLGLVVGRAGAGKTTLAAAIAEVHQGDGYQVFGAALAAKAARGLEEASGIPSSTVASLVSRIDSGQVQLGRKTLLVVDEAGILDTPQLAGLLDRAAAAGSKVVLMGDPDQLQPIGAGAPFRGLLAEHAHAELGEIRRQRDPEQAALVGGLARARVHEALAAHDAAGRLEWHGNVSEAREAMADRWMSRPAEERPLLVAYRRQDVAELNRLVQDRRVAAGELGREAGVGELRIGDQVVFGRNGMVEFGERVQNGVVGRLEGVSGSNLRIRIEGRGEVEVDPRVYRELDLGYALSLHRSQGQTADRVEVLADRLMDRHAAYVALSRHRDDVRLHVPIALAAGSAADGKLLEGAAADGRLHLGNGRGVDVGSLGAPDRAALGRDLVEVDRRALVSGLAERMSESRAKGLARDHRGELDYAGIVKAREDVLEQSAERRAAQRAAVIVSQQAGYYAEALPAARAAIEARKAELGQAVAKVYAEPDRVMRALVGRAAQSQDHSTMQARDAERLAALRGRDRAVLGPDQERRAATAALPGVPKAFERLVAAHRDLAELEARHQGFKARNQPTNVPQVPQQLATAGLSAARLGLSVAKGMIESPDRAAVAAGVGGAAMVVGAVSPTAGSLVGLAGGVLQANSAESAFLTATSSLGKMALTKAATMLPPALAAPALVGIRVLGKVIDVTGPER